MAEDDAIPFRDQPRSEIDPVDGLAGGVVDDVSDVQRMLVLDDRRRIARDLHDHVIQQLYAVGLELQSIESTIAADQTAQRLDTTVSMLNDAIAQIRTTIFALSRQAKPGSSIRHRLIELVNQLNNVLPRPVRLALSGPIDLVVDAALADDVVAFARESLSNVARHARATSASLAVSATLSLLTLVVEDDGIGIGDVARRSGLENGMRRAERHGGRLEIETGDWGTRLTWSVPLAHDE